MAAARIDAHISFLNTAGATLASNAIPAGTQGTWRLRITVAEGTLSGADRIIVDRYNLQALCPYCHSAKSRAERLRLLDEEEAEAAP